MRDFVLLFAVCIAIVIGVGWFLLPGPARDLLHRTNITVQADDSDRPPVEEPPPPPRPRIRPQVAPDPAPAAPVAAVRPPRLEPVFVPPAVSARLPYPWEVLPGEEKAELVQGYGQPLLSTSTEDAGHLFETYVYHSDRTQSIVHLEDGRVSGVSLKDYPLLWTR